MGWLRRNKNERPVRPESVRQRPPNPLYLDGGASWKAYTGPDDVDQLGRLPVDSEIVVEAVPEPNNRYDPTAVALLYDGARVGYLYRSLSRSLFGAIRAANAAGYHVLLHAKRTRQIRGPKHNRGPNRTGGPGSADRQQLASRGSSSLSSRPSLLAEPPAARTWNRIFRACLDKDRLSGFLSGPSESTARKQRLPRPPMHLFHRQPCN